MVHQALKGAPWVGSYSVAPCIRPLMGQTVHCWAVDAGMWGDRGCSDGSTTLRYDSAVLPGFHGCLAFLYNHFPPQSPPSCPLNQSLHSQQQPLHWDCSTIPTLQFPATEPSRGTASLSGVCMAAVRTVWLSFYLCCHRSVTLSLKCFSSDSHNYLDVGIRPLLQFPHLLRVGPILLILLFFPLVPSSYWVLCGSIYSFPLVRSSCPLSAGVLHALLCLKVCSWCIHGEGCTRHPPISPPSCSPHCSLYWTKNPCKFHLPT